MSGVVNHVKHAMDYFIIAVAFKGDSEKTVSACVQDSLDATPRRYFSGTIQTLKMGAVRAAVGAGFAAAVGVSVSGGAALGAGYALTHKVVVSMDQLLDKINRRITGNPDLDLLARLLVESPSALYGVSALTGCGLLGVPALVAAAYISRNVLSKALGSIADYAGIPQITVFVKNLVVKPIEAAAYTFGLKVALAAAVKFGVISAFTASLPLSIPFGIAMGAVGVGMVAYQTIANGDRSLENYNAIRFKGFLENYV